MPAKTTKFDCLNDENYHNWKTYIEAILVRKGLWPVVIGLERHPGGTECWNHNAWHQTCIVAMTEIVMKIVSI
jgi:hypothetical protein